MRVSIGVSSAGQSVGRMLPTPTPPDNLKKSNHPRNNSGHQQMIQPSAFDLWGTFLFFASFCLFMAAFVMFALPETKGVPLENMVRLRCVVLRCYFNLFCVVCCDLGLGLVGGSGGWVAVLTCRPPPQPTRTHGRHAVRPSLPLS